MKKKVLIVILIILSFIIAVKTREIIILNKINSSIIDFKNQENRYYSVIENINNKTKIEKEKYLTKNIEKHVLRNDTIGEYCELKNFQNGEFYNYNLRYKIRYISNTKFKDENNLMYLPKIISDICDLNNKKFSELFKIHYIMPTTYENKPCYKISTNFEIVIIDKETYLPVYSSIKTVNSGEGDNSTEYIYKFEVNTVTDEDVALPDFSDYTIE